MSMEHIFRQWIGMHRAMIAWFHAAHHVTKGTGFGGDHVNLYGEIYTKLDEDLDGIIEKGIGLTGDETLADPVSSLSLAATLLAQQPASANQSAETIASNAFEVIKYYVSAIESIYSQFEASGMSLGLDDLLQGLANQYETYVYLLQQRSRTVSLHKESKMRMTESQLRRTIRQAILNEGFMDSIGDFVGNFQSASSSEIYDAVLKLSQMVADASGNRMDVSIQSMFESKFQPILEDIAEFSGGKTKFKKLLNRLESSGKGNMDQFFSELASIGSRLTHKGAQRKHRTRRGGLHGEDYSNAYEGAQTLEDRIMELRNWTNDKCAEAYRKKY